MVFTSLEQPPHYLSASTRPGGGPAGLQGTRTRASGKPGLGGPGQLGGERGIRAPPARAGGILKFTPIAATRKAGRLEKSPFEAPRRTSAPARQAGPVPAASQCPAGGTECSWVTGSAMDVIPARH